MSTASRIPGDSENVLKKTSQTMVDIIYDTLEITHDLLTKAKINYTILGGTMLGSKRHGGLIPWDDDGDIGIEIKDEQKLLALKDAFADRDFVLGPEPLFGYRVWHRDRTVLQERYQLHVPFVDIFMIKNDSNRYHYTTKKIKEMYPGEPLPYGCFERLIDASFGHLTLRGLNDNDAREHLTTQYGPNWSFSAYRDYDHLTGEIIPAVVVVLDQPTISRPALHSKHTEDVKKEDNQAILSSSLSLLIKNNRINQ
jgi:lipopolysaccharide cholinephosphotransferase